MSGVLPDVLVLAAGGVLGEAWTSGLLAGIEEAEAVDLRRVESFVGTSAGAIVAARLAAGERPRRVEAARRGRTERRGPAPSGGSASGGPAGSCPTGGGHAGGGHAGGGSRSVLGAVAGGAVRAAWAASAPLAPAALALGAPGGARVRALALARARAPRGSSLAALRRDLRALGTRFDGRLRICAVDRATGRRVVFGAPGAPSASVADAVVASCSVPWVFPPVRIGGREYVDGGVWSVTNLDAAPAGEDSRVLLVDPTASLGDFASAFGLLRAGARVATELERLVLRGRGVRVQAVAPGPAAADLMRADLMATRPARAVHEAGYAQGLETGLEPSGRR